MGSLRRFCFSVSTATLLMQAGCASIVSGRHADVSIHSYPTNAHVVIRDKRGQEVASVNTPGTVVLKRTDRFIFPARYTAIVEAPGYQTAQLPIGPTLNPWLLGNIVIGGIPGLVIDSATGAAWKPKQSEIFAALTPFEPAEQRLPRPTVAAAEDVTVQAR